jgi:hypothetical protein
MAAGLGFKTFTTGEVLTAGDTNGYLMQGVLVFASAAARTSAITSPQEGQMSYLKDTNSTEYYSGSAWVAVGGGGGMTLISTTTLSGATVTLSSIPQTYKNLIVLVNGYTGNTSNNRIRLLPNNVSNLAYATGVRQDTGSAEQYSATVIYPNMNQSILRTDANNSSQVTIFNYASTTQFKPFNTNHVIVGTDSAYYAGISGGAFMSNTAISSIVFDYGGTNTFAGGTVLLYGVS